MKKLSILTCAFALLFSYNVKAQHEVKTNVLGLLINQYGLSYEHVLNDNMGIVGQFTYFTPPSSFSYEYQAIGIAPEFRYYFAPKRGGDRFFAAGYMRYRNTNADNYTTVENNGVSTSISQQTNGLAIGVNTGSKWVTNSGFLFEISAGFGRYLIDEASYSNGYDPDADNSGLGVVIGAVDDLPKWDIRLAITVGWRF